MKNILRYLSLITLLCALCVACDYVSDSERLIYVEPPVIGGDDEPSVVGHNVLIEDFTGQSCINCPNATLEIANLQKAYGHDNVVAVGLYSGSFGRSRRGVPYALTTEVGDEYFTHWGLDSQPIGMVNRQSPSDYADWATQVRAILEQKSRVKLEPTATYNTSSRTITVKVVSTAMEEAVDGKIQVWLTEDDIVAFQYQPDGSSDKNYVHNHVFRDVLNGTWGTDFHLDKAEEKTEQFTYAIPEGKLWTSADPIPTDDVPKYWNVENMHVVVFVYNDGGVEQVEYVKLEIED